MYRVFFKRFLDLVLALIGIVLLSPILLLATIFLFFANRGKVFFFQRRPGKNGKIFMIIKFKTMNDLCDKNGVLLPDSKRLTKVGKFVRRTSIDEIPQLLNVIWGHMSLIGPRPLLVEYLPLYNEVQKTRHNIRPGITGWAQVNGRNAISWDQKFSLDIWYVNNFGLILDLKIIYLTIKKVFFKEGISSNTSMTMEKFTGK
ncbi:sugar transferase [Pedobacter polysacchareus]|uniref:sugar transferase n=1 Tax=Pedobacter polysacchareus TaxID=2861973 RepID=UPI001C997AA9|nr:sugar transferase [Pedobacter polysacchareus]